MFRSLITAALVLFALASQAQPSGGPSPQQPPVVPIDGGASLLLAGGVAYTIRKVQQRRKK